MAEKITSDLQSLSPTLARFVADMQKAAAHAGKVMAEALEPLLNIEPPKGPGPLYAHPPVTAEPDTCDEHNDWFTCYEGADGSWFISHHGTQYVPVTAEPAPVPEAANAREVIEDILRNDPENPGVPRLFPISAQDVLKALDARGLTVVDARNVVTAEPATAPSVDLVDGLNVEEWADHADRLKDLYHGLLDVVRNAGEALKEHGFTSDTLESQTLAESIHALAGRGAPSVEQIAEVFERWEVTSKHGRPSWTLLAEDIRALYGTPGDTGEESPGKARGYSDDTLSALATAQSQRERAEKAEARVERLEEERTACGYADLRAEVERCKAALEAAEKHIRALSLRFEAEKGQWAAETNVFHRTRDAAKTYQAWDAARAAVEAETSEEA